MTVVSRGVEPTALLPVIDDVFRWSVWNEPRKLWFNAHLLEVGDARVVIDPVPISDEVGAALAARPPTVCVVTNRDHVRAAAELRARFGARVLVARGDARLIELAADGTVDDGDLVAGALRVVRVADAKTAGEIALHWPARSLLVLGDAAVGRPAGALSMLPDEKFPDPAKARAAVARLAALDVQVVLVGDGDDVLEGGSLALAALGSGPARAPAGAAPGC